MNHEQAIQRAQQLRQAAPEAEQRLWTKLRNRRFGEFKFRRQVPLGKYIADFVCFDRKLILELDGGQHTLQREYDAERTKWLAHQGYRVVRFWNHEVGEDSEAVDDLIWRRLHDAMPQNPSLPAPLPQGERGE